MLPSTHPVKPLWCVPCLIVWCGLLLSATVWLSATPTKASELYQYAVKRVQWPAHVNGQNILALPAVKETLSRFTEDGRIRIIIGYPGGDPGKKWATELQNWLVSFGVPSSYIELQLGSGAGDQLAIEVIDREFN